jgi:hypothetical protein
MTPKSDYFGLFRGLRRPSINALPRIVMMNTGLLDGKI